MTTFTMRRVGGEFVITGPDIEPKKFKTRKEAREWCTTHYRGSPTGRSCPSASALPRGVQMVTDLSNILRQEAATCRRLAELVTEQTIRQELIEMAARLQAIADEVDEP
jgi:hypothetical protein